MKAKKKGLQKFTNSEGKIDEILALEQINLCDLQVLSKSECTHLLSVLTERLNSLKGEDRDKFFKKIEPIVSDITKNQIWESNHIQITCAIATLMQEYGRMPTKTEIAMKTELSRQTIHKHLNEYSNHPQYILQIEQFKFMTSKVLAKVFKYAVNGDVRAAKLYLELMSNLKAEPTNNTVVQHQNNYIQINGTVLSQNSISKLNSEQLNQIENIIKLALPHVSTQGGENSEKAVINS